MPVKKIFLGTSKSLPELAADRLLKNAGPLPILNKILVAVPGNYAAEKLQENLAALAPRGLIAPQIMTPGVLLHCGTVAANTPSALENELIWCNVAETAAKSRCFDMLFPAYNENTPVSGGAFSRLRLELAAGGFSIADAADNLGTRAEQLVEIEQLYLEELEKLGFTMPKSSANFVFAKHERVSGKEIYLKLKEKGVLVRHFDKVRLTEYNRITIGSLEQMNILLKKLKEILEETK